ncbi:MAG: hypothetical protein KBB33_08645, partial [Candidatus Cloacimonetes bacterium]|nr:hypothetical protein [Candidatus Cloacimonadota bacterium]
MIRKRVKLFFSWGGKLCFATMGSQLFFQIVSPFFQIGSFVGLRYHDFFKRVSRLLQIILSLL